MFFSIIILLIFERPSQFNYNEIIFSSVSISFFHTIFFEVVEIRFFYTYSEMFAVFIDTKDLKT